MKKRYRLHPAQYAIRQNENFYSGMAAKGWILEKRGTYVSRFRRAAPQKLIYRVELSEPAPYSESNVPPQELISLYEACGWTFVVRRGLICIFSAPIGVAQPEIPANPERNSAVRRSMQKNAAAAFAALAVALCGLIVLASRGLLHEIRLAWYTDTAKMLLTATALLLLLFEAAVDTMSAIILYFRLQKGRPAANVPCGSGRLHCAGICLLLAACLVFAVMTGAQLRFTQSCDMPVAASGPYILLSELGWTGERTYSYQVGNVSSVTHVRSLLTEQWYTREFVEEQPDGAVCMLRQEVYQLKNPQAAMAIVAPLMEKAIFAKGEAAFTPISVQGLDAAWESAFEYIAIKDSTIYYLIYLDSSTGTPAGPKVNVLEVLAKILKYRENP